MINKIDLSTWKKQDEIILELHREWGINITPREWRLVVEKNNKMFAEGLTEYYITHSNQFGYKTTKDYQEAKVGRNDYLKRALNMLKKVKECDNAFKVIDNIKIDFGKEDFYENN